MILSQHLDTILDDENYLAKSIDQKYQAAVTLAVSDLVGATLTASQMWDMICVMESTIPQEVWKEFVRQEELAKEKTFRS